MSAIKSTFLAALTASALAMPNVSLAEQGAGETIPNIEENQPESMQLAYADNHGRFVVYTVQIDEDKAWSLSSEYAMTSFGFMEGRGSFAMAHGADGVLTQDIDGYALQDKFASECWDTLKRVVSQSEEGASFFLGHDSRQDRARLIVRNDDADWRMISLFYNPKGSNRGERCVDSYLEMRPVEMIPGTDIPMPQGGVRASLENNIPSAYRFG